MNNQTKQNDNRGCDRRRWLASAGRWAAFGTLAVLSVGLLTRGHDQCSHDGPGGCNDCSSLTKCRHPQALKLKQQNEKKRDNDRQQ